MEYIRESLTGNERLVAVGRFHWVYFVGAGFWIVLGLLACTFILVGGVAWTIKADMSTMFPDLPAHLHETARAEIVKKSGGYLALIRDLHGGVKGAAFGSLILGLLLFAHMMVVRLTTEVAVTTSRLVVKDGIISRNVDEMSVDRIESVHVIQSILGRILGYGIVMVRGMGIGEILLPPIADPIAFRNALEKARQADEEEKRR